MSLLLKNLRTEI